MKWTEHHTRQEAIDACSRMDARERMLLLARLEKHSRRSSYDSPSDLFNEVLCRMLDGKRRWPIGVDFTTFVVNAGHSIVSSERQRADHANVSIDHLMSWDENGDESPSPLLGEVCRATASPSAEDEALARERIRFLVDLNVRTALVLAEDKLAKRAAEGYLLGKTSAELQTELGVDAKTMKAASQRARRAFTKTGGDMNPAGACDNQ